VYQTFQGEGTGAPHSLRLIRLIYSKKKKKKCKVDHRQVTATLSYASRNWDTQNSKFEIGFEGYKERSPAEE